MLLRADNFGRQSDTLGEFERPRFFGEKRVRPGFDYAVVTVKSFERAAQTLAALEQRDFHRRLALRGEFAYPMRRGESRDTAADYGDP